MDTVNDYWIAESDSLTYLESLTDNTIDLIIFDPPYGISRDRIFKRPGTKDLDFSFGEWDKISDEKWLELIRIHYLEFTRVLKPNGSIYTFCTTENAGFVKLVEGLTGFYHKAAIVWCKTNPVIQFRKKNYLSSIECVSFAVKDKNNFTFNFINQKKMKNWRTMPIVMRKGRHPTEKPVDLIKWFVSVSSNYGDVVLDPMMGSGTTGVSARSLGRIFLGVDINEEYVNMTRGRIENTSRGRKPLW